MRDNLFLPQEICLRCAKQFLFLFLFFYSFLIYYMFRSLFCVLRKDLDRDLHSEATQPLGIWACAWCFHCAADVQCLGSYISLQYQENSRGKRFWSSPFTSHCTGLFLWIVLVSLALLYVVMGLQSLTSICNENLVYLFYGNPQGNSKFWLPFLYIMVIKLRTRMKQSINSCLVSHCLGGSKRVSLKADGFNFTPTP